MEQVEEKGGAGSETLTEETLSRRLWVPAFHPLLESPQPCLLVLSPLCLWPSLAGIFHLLFPHDTAAFPLTLGFYLKS